MKTIIKKICAHSTALLLLLLITGSCENIVEPEVFSEMTPEKILATEDGVPKTLLSGYNYLAIVNNARIPGSLEFTTDIAWETGGGANQWAVAFIHLRYDESTANLWGMWNRRYRAVRNANIVLDNLDGLDLPDADKKLYRAEARFIRAVSYQFLNRWFGPVPLRTSTEDEMELPRTTADEMESFIEQELLEIISDLPEYGNEPGYGRAHKSAARAFLTKFYLNTKQWQKAADMAKNIIDGGKFSLFPSYPDLFRVENERNSEYIWVHQNAVGVNVNNHMNAALPPNFKEHPPTNMVWTPNMNNWARQDRLMDSFADSFEEGDERHLLIADWYIDLAGDSVSLRELPDNQRALKYPLDPNAQGGHGNDIPELRYADILLSRAEALNELNGPNQESIDLINQVRERAGLNDILLGDFGSKEELREYIVMKERGWEFYWEMKRRQDLIRIGKFIEVAQSLGSDRGNPSAEEYRVLFPIPQQAIDSNPKLEQNPGY